MATYPGAIPSFATLTDGVDDVLATHQNTPNAEITAIATELGTDPKTITDATAPGASPASVGVYLDMVAAILKAITGATNWYQANVAAIMKSIGTTKGDIISFTGSGVSVRHGVGTNDYVLTANSNISDGVEWMQVPMDIRTKYIITPSIATNDLTIALKYIDGNDPTTTNKLIFRVGNTEYAVTAATSFTKNDGTNWCNAGSAETAAQNIDFFLYAIGETGASAGIKFGFSRIPYAKTMSDFVNTTTSEKYIAGNWTNFNATDAVKNIGRFRAQLSAAAAHNWSIPSALVVNYPIYTTEELAYSPQWTSSGVAPALGDGTLTGTYQVVNNNFLAEVQQLMGATTTFGTGNYRWSMPFTAATYLRSPCYGLDSGTAHHIAVSIPLISNLLISAISEGATASWGQLVPHTWAVNDTISLRVGGRL